MSMLDFKRVLVVERMKTLHLLMKFVVAYLSRGSARGIILFILVLAEVIFSRLLFKLTETNRLSSQSNVPLLCLNNLLSVSLKIFVLRLTEDSNCHEGLHH